jgi:hypothetical protein
MDDLPRDFVIDVTQQVGRKAWRYDGMVKCPHTQAKVWHKGRILNHASWFNIMGWPRGTVNFPDSLSNRARSRLVGNMLATPTVGAVLLAACSEIRWTD